MKSVAEIKAELRSVEPGSYREMVLLAQLRAARQRRKAQ